MPNILYIPIIMAVMFCVGWLLVMIPGIRNRLKRDSKHFSDEEMEKLTNYRNKKFASEHEEYSYTPTNLE